MNNKRYFIYVFLCAGLLFLGACGVKPAYVDPPEGAEHSDFPRTYPDTRTDPQPGLERKDF